MIRYLYKKSRSKPKAFESRLQCAHQAASIQPVPPHSSNVQIEQAEKDPAASVSPEASSATNQNSKLQQCCTCVNEKKTRRSYRWRVIIGLMPAFFLASLDLTIVATALPFIASHFNKFNQLNWIVTAFTLTSTAFIPAWGQLADLLGRHTSIQAAVLFMIIGSTLCATAVNWPMLLLGRALQGISAAGIQNLTLIILADNVSLKEQAKNTSIFQLVNGVGYSVGPVIGGYLTNKSWRWCFVLGIPLAVVSNISIFFLLHKHLKPGNYLSHANESRTQAVLRGLRSLDFGGMTLFMLGSGLIILGTAWGGSTFSWTSAAVLVSIVAGAMIFCLFFAWEYLLEPGRLLSRLLPKTQAMVPFFLFRRRDVGLIALIAAATGTALYSVFYFIGIYFTLVEAYPASQAGTQLLYYVPGLGAGVYIAIYLCNIRPRQTFWPLCIGTIIETAGLAVLTYAVGARKSTLVNVMMAIAGAGTGMRFMPSNLHLAGIWPDQIAAVYSILRFALPFGGTLALTIMGSVFQNKMSVFFGSLAANGNNTTFSLHNQAALQAINNLSPAEQVVIRHTGAQATMWAFISILPILGLSVIASMSLGNVQIAKKATASQDSEDTGSSRKVIHSMFLLTMLRRREKTEKKSNQVVTDSGQIDNMA